MRLRPISTLLLLAFLSGCGLFFVRWPKLPAPKQSTLRAQLAETDRVRRWREDTEALRALLLAKHPNPFFRGTERVTALASQLGPEQEDLFGCEVLAVEGVPLDRLVEVSSPGRAGALPACRLRAALEGWFHPGPALDQGLLPDTPAWTYTFRGLDGREFQRRLPRAQPKEGNWRGSAAPKGTLRRRHPEKVAFLEWLPERHAAYIRYRSCESHHPSLMALLKEVDWERESRGATRLVVDLRGNGGGNSLYHWRFQRALARHPVFGKPGRLSVLTDVGTFSSAFLLAWDLRRDAGARIVGETSGQPANAYGDIRFHNLLNFKSVSVGISSKDFFRAGGDPVDFNRFLVPDLPAPMTAQSWMRGEDPTLEAALAGN